MLARSVLAGAALLTLAAGPALAETVHVTADRMIDVLTGRVVQGAALVAVDGRITEAGRASDITAPADARRIDLGGMTMLPGLIDMHVHLTGRHDMHGYRGLAETTADEAISGVVHAGRTLMAGFTTVRNVGAGGFADVALRTAIADGRVPGPRLVVSGPPLGATGGHCDNNLLPAEYEAKGRGIADGPWGLVAKVREMHKFGADLIKICATGGVLSKGTTVGAQQLTEEEIAAIVGEAHRLGMKVAAHAHGTDGIKAAIRGGVDTVEHASFIDAEGIKLAKANGTWLSMDIYVTEYILSEGEAAGILPESLEKERITGGTQRTNFQQAVKAGAGIVYGTDAGVYPHGQNGLQMARMVRFGMTPMQAVQAATANAAIALGREADVGALAVGRYADIIAVAGDPLADMTLFEAVPVVIKGGVVVKDQR